MVPALAHKGVYRWRCCIKGRAAHSSLTPQSVNAIEIGARVVGKLGDMAERFRSGAAVRRLRRAVHDELGRRHRRRHRRQRRARGLPLPLRIPQPAGRRRAGDAGRGARLRRVARAGDARGRARGRHPLRADLRDAGVPRPCRRSGGAARVASRPRPTRRRSSPSARKRPVPGRRHPDGGVRAGPHRAGAPGRRVRDARAARRRRALPARPDDDRHADALGAAQPAR